MIIDIQIFINKNKLNTLNFKHYPSHRDDTFGTNSYLLMHRKHRQFQFKEIFFIDFVAKQVFENTFFMSNKSDLVSLIRRTQTIVSILLFFVVMFFCWKVTDFKLTEIQLSYWGKPSMEYAWL